MVTLLNNPNVCPSTLTDTVHRLISMLSDKTVRVVVGPSACIDSNHTVYLPPLPKDATERDFVKYFHVGTHEQAHIYGASDFIRASKDKVRFGLENSLEDVRCEQVQEKAYPGLVPYRIRFYHDALEDFLSDEFSRAEPDNIKRFINTLGKYIIAKARMIQLDALNLNLNASDSLIKAYYTHIADLESRIVDMRTSDEMFELSGIIYDRLKDLIREDIKNKTNPPQQGDNNEQGNDQSDSESSSENGDEGGEEKECDDSDDSDRSSEEESSGSEGSEGDDKETDTDTNNDEGGPDEASVEPDQGTDEKDGNDVHSTDESEEVNGSTEEDHDDNSEDESSGDSSSKGKLSGDDGSGDSNDDDSDAEIEGKVQEILDELGEDCGPMDVTTEIINQVNEASTYEQPYMVHPNVNDIITKGEETTNDNATLLKKIGLDMLGPKGAQLTKLFISQTKPREQYNQRSGSLDVVSFASDVNDVRDDVFRNKSAAKLDKAAITFLMDNSTSMRPNIGNLYALLSGILFNLSRACIPTEAIGYTIVGGASDKWRDVPAVLTIIKEFKESYDGKVMRRCVPPKFLGFTNDLDGMLFAVPRLWARPEKKKIIMILCDGQPYMGNGSLTNKVTKAYKEYIDICRKAGIIVFGFGLDVDLSDIFGTDWVTVSTTNVSEVLNNKLTSILNRGRA